MCITFSLTKTAFLNLPLFCLEKNIMVANFIDTRYKQKF